jgi:tetratricopeptide (TPR) repeat protein
MPMRVRRHVLAYTVCAAALSACSTTQKHEISLKIDPKQQAEFLADKPDKLKRLYGRILPEGDRNAVLNYTRIGVAAFETGEIETAGKAFDEALNRIEAIYADNEKAEAARSKFVKENAKDFKGEPYERAMAYYYRGLAYLAEGDYENARASFKGGMLQDSLAADEKFNADFASLAFLEGWSSHCMGRKDAAASAFAEAHKLRSELVAPSPNDNLLLIAESGTSPTKVSSGEFKEKMEPHRGTPGVVRTAFTIGEKTVPAILAEDVWFQASTRGGRQVQAILDGKAEFKDGMNTAAAIGVGGGLGMMNAGSRYNDNNMAAAGAIVLLVGVMAHAAAAATTPEADLRYWDNLPDNLHFATLSIPAGEVSVTMADNQNKPIQMRVTHKGECAIGWGRTHSALAIPIIAPFAVKE